VRKLPAALAVVGLVVVALALSSCGGSSNGKEGGTLKGTYASFPDYLDPGLSYTQEGLTAMYDTYIPLLTYARANGTAGGKVEPGLAKSMPKISNGGKTYTLNLRKGLKYSDGKPVKASDFTHAVERTIALNSPGSPFYASAIVGAEKFQKTKTGGISGIKTDDKTGKIVIDLNAPRGTFANELGLLLVAPVPGDTPLTKNTTLDPPPATGPYEIVEVEAGREWSYRRNPQWAKNNAKLMPDLPSGHVNKIEIKVVSNQATQVNEVEQGTSDWMQSLVPADRYAEVKSKYEGTQFRVEPTNSTYYFWMNTTKPPFDDVKVRQAVNYAVSGAAMERVYSGQLKANQQILPPGMPGYEEFELYPYDMAKAKKMIAEANPSDREITVWTDTESPNKEAGEYYDDVLRKIGFDTTLKIINADDYFTVIGNQSTPDLDTGWSNWFQDYPHPNDFFQPLLAGESILPTNNPNYSLIDVPALNAKITRLSAEEFGSEQEAEYAKLDREYMELAPWAPYGNLAVSTFVSSSINLDDVIFNPTFGQALTSFQFK
jgi:peptide/nickel transport system substrate-binding protein